VWVEKGQAADLLIAAHLKGNDWTQPHRFPLDPAQVVFTRPLFPYPMRAKYSGRGNANEAKNFVPSRT
jgi:Tannase and feruloyl esterase